MPPLLGLFLSMGTIFGLLAAACAYVIAYSEYRQRMLRMNQNAKTMALQTAVTTFVFFIVATVVLYVVLRPKGQ
jgi:cell division protein FtsX